MYTTWVMGNIYICINISWYLLGSYSMNLKNRSVGSGGGWHPPTYFLVGIFELHLANETLSQVEQGHPDWQSLAIWIGWIQLGSLLSPLVFLSHLFEKRKCQSANWLPYSLPQKVPLLYAPTHKNHTREKSRFCYVSNFVIYFLLTRSNN